MISQAATYLGTELPAYDSRYKRNPAQLTYAQSIDDALDQGLGRLHCIEGDTGIGKSLAYLIPLAHWVRQRGKKPRRVVLSTFSRSLQRQLASADNQRLVNAYLSSHGLRPLRFAIRMGRGNYVSQSRLTAMLEAFSLQDVVNDSTRSDRERTLARWAITSEGCLLDLDDDDFPQGIEAADIAVAPGEALPEALAEHFRDTQQADVMIINHALLVNDLVAGGCRLTGNEDFETALLLDEAEHFLDVAANQLSHRLSYGQVVLMAERMGYKAAKARWQELLAVSASPRWAATARDIPSEQVEQITQALKSIQRTRRKPSDDENALIWAQIRETAGALLSRVKRGAQDVVIAHSPVKGLPGLAYSNMDAASCLLRAMPHRITILTSATLSDMAGTNDKPTYRYILNGLLIGQSDDRVGILRSHGATNFGRLRFHVPTDMPKPLQQHEGGYELTREYARKAIRHLLHEASGRTLVLCSSYADVAVLIDVWPDKHRARLVTHPPGANINAVAQQLTEHAVLVTPAGWEGLSPERGRQAFWSRVVVLRNPTPALNPAEQLLVANRLQQRGCSKGVASNRAKAIGFAKANTRTLHKIRQGIGRALRHPDDDVEIVILDPRFGGSKRNHEGGSPQGLSRAIPSRFWSAYKHATLRNQEKPAIIL